MSDIIYETDQALKEMNRLWRETLKKEHPDKVPMNYQRFKILRAVAGGQTISGDIAEATGTDLSTTAQQLHALKEDRYLTREPVNCRAFEWKVTPRGKTEAERMSRMLDKMREELRHVVKSRLDIWL